MCNKEPIGWILAAVALILVVGCVCSGVYEQHGEKALEQLLVWSFAGICGVAVLVGIVVAGLAFYFDG